MGTVSADGSGNPLRWNDAPTENVDLDTTEVWEVHNFTEDAHPIHIHEVQFQVVEQESLENGGTRGHESWESGYKDTVVAYPGEITSRRPSTGPDASHGTATSSTTKTTK